MIVALFFLFDGQCTICIVESNNNVAPDLGHDSVGLERNIMGIHTLDGSWCMSDLLRARNVEKGFLITSNSFGITDLALVFANITNNAHMVAIDNNSLLNAKTVVYVVAVQNITVNGVRLLSGDVHKIPSPFPQILAISNGTLQYVIRLRQVASLDDIEDPDRPVNATAEYNMFHLAGVTIGGSIASLASLIFWIIVLVFIKSQKVHEGLPNEL